MEISLFLFHRSFSYPTRPFLSPSSSLLHVFFSLPLPHFWRGEIRMEKERERERDAFSCCGHCASPKKMRGGSLSHPTSHPHSEGNPMKKKKSHTLFQYGLVAIYGDTKYRRIITWASSLPVVCRLLQNFFTAFPRKIFPSHKDICVDQGGEGPTGANLET